MMLAILLLFAVNEVCTIRLRCGNYSAEAQVNPPLNDNTGLLVPWDLLSHDPVCTDPPRIPGFSSLTLTDVSLIAVCNECPTCTVRLPMRFEMPLGSSIQSIFIVTRNSPHQRLHTDLDIRYVYVDRLPPTLRNCQLEVREKVEQDALLSLSNVLVFLSILFSVILGVCCLRWLCIKIYL